MAPDFGLTEPALRMGRHDLGRAHSNRPEKVQHHYVQAIGGSVAVPAFRDRDLNAPNAHFAVRNLLLLIARQLQPRDPPDRIGFALALLLAPAG
jgi:hypothetical protein